MNRRIWILGGLLPALLGVGVTEAVADEYPVGGKPGGPRYEFDLNGASWFSFTVERPAELPIASGISGFISQEHSVRICRKGWAQDDAGFTAFSEGSSVWSPYGQASPEWPHPDNGQPYMVWAADDGAEVFRAGWNGERFRPSLISCAGGGVGPLSDDEPMRVDHVFEYIGSDGPMVDVKGWIELPPGGRLLAVASGSDVHVSLSEDWGGVQAYASAYPGAGAGVMIGSGRSLEFPRTPYGVFRTHNNPALQAGASSITTPQGDEWNRSARPGNGEFEGTTGGVYSFDVHASVNPERQNDPWLVPFGLLAVAAIDFPACEALDQTSTIGPAPYCQADTSITMIR